MEKIELRKAIIADLPTLYEFEQGIITFERPYDSTLKPDPINYYDLEEMINSNESEVIVAVSKNEIVGSAYAKIKEAKPYLNHEQYAYMGFMFVLPTYRGRGINKMIIDQLLDWAKSKNIDEIRLDVYNDNHTAVRAYEKAGFAKQMVNMRLSIKERENLL